MLPRRQTCGPAEVNAAAMGLAELADHIEATHHAYLKSELPRLVEMADRVATKHGWRDTRLPAIAVMVNELAREMISHLEKEEIILFPRARSPTHKVANPPKSPSVEIAYEHFHPCRSIGESSSHKFP